jgi:hypothetical protein
MDKPMADDRVEVVRLRGEGGEAAVDDLEVERRPSAHWPPDDDERR